MNILCVFGTRPEAIKLAPVIHELYRCSKEQRAPNSPGGSLRIVVCVTGQHRHMLDQVLGLFAISPDYDLNVMEDNQSPSQVASAVLARLEPILKTERPMWVLLQGDTTTAAAAALAAFYAHVRVGHVEAGLRTRDRRQPFPEEINRRLVGAIADMHFAPTERARQNLLVESVPDSSVRVTGNTVIDAVRWVASLPPPGQLRELFRRSGLETGAAEESGTELASAPREFPSGRRLILVTAHRRENFGQGLENICLALRELAARYADLRFIYPVHLNPNVQQPVRRLLAGVPNILLTPPLDYLSMVHLLKHSYLLLTDSGGLQEEAPGLGVPVLVLREVTERPEGVEAGVARLVGVDRKRIVAEASRLVEDRDVYERMARAVPLYGDGYAASRIVSELLRNQDGALRVLPSLVSRENETSALR